MKRVAFYTLGCKVNQYDTEAMLECFEQAGYTVVDFKEEADVYVVNTCTVTGTGDQKSRRIIRRTARQNPQAAIVVAGCLAQREAEEVLKIPGVALVVGSQKRGQVVEMLEQALGENRKISAVSALKGVEFEELSVSGHEGKTRATMKIQEGCDRYCAYCIIPSVRGPVRSMALASVKQEAQRLSAAGYRELVLTGIHLASYGRGMDIDLLSAIEAVHEVDGVKRIRLGSLEPSVVSDEFVARLIRLPKVCKQFHLSMQSGSRAVLERMRRSYTPEEYAQAVDRLRGAFKDCAITTDVLCGFPGETEAEHAETMAFVERIAFARIHVFPYSRREGTVADRMPDQIPQDVKNRRAAELIALGNRLETEFVQSLIGSKQEVLFEEKDDKGLCQGYTGQYVRVHAVAQPGDLCVVHIDSAQGATAFGSRV